MDQRVLIIIPAWNEANSIEAVVREARTAMPAATVLVIDDGSTDRTSALAAGAGAKVVRLPCNLGIGGAMQTGYRYALEHDFDVAIQLDGDGQHDPFQIPLLLRELERANLVVGSRFLPNVGFQSSSVRRIGIRFFSWLLRCLTSIVVTDPTSGFRAVDKQVIRYFADRYPIDFPEVEVISRLASQGFKIIEVPVVMRERQGGVSSINFTKSIWYMVKVSAALLIGESKS